MVGWGWGFISEWRQASSLSILDMTCYSNFTSNTSSGVPGRCELQKTFLNRWYVSPRGTGPGPRSSAHSFESYPRALEAMMTLRTPPGRIGGIPSAPATACSKPLMVDPSPRRHLYVNESVDGSLGGVWPRRWFGSWLSLVVAAAAVVQLRGTAAFTCTARPSPSYCKAWLRAPRHSSTSHNLSPPKRQPLVASPLRSSRPRIEYRSRT